MNENDILFQKVTQAYSEKNPSAPIVTFYVSLSGIIYHSHSFTRLKIYHHTYLIYIKDVDFLYNESRCGFVPHLCLQRFLE